MKPPIPRRENHHEVGVSGLIGSLQLHFEARFSAPWTVLFGPSGCGKSTLLRSVCGLTNGLQIRVQRTTDEGKLLVLQDDNLRVPTAQRRLGYAPQGGGLFPHLSVEENVSFGARVRGGHGSGAKHHGLIEEAMSLLDLATFRHRLPRELSGGERQRVSLARALAVPDIRLLLLDEPFAGIDRALRDALLPGIQQWSRRRGVPVISVTHDVDEVFLLQAEVVRLHEGGIVAQGRPEDVLGDEVERVQRALATRS